MVTKELSVWVLRLWRIVTSTSGVIITIQYLYSAMKTEDTEALGGARLRLGCIAGH